MMFQALTGLQIPADLGLTGHWSHALKSASAVGDETISCVRDHSSSLEPHTPLARRRFQRISLNWNYTEPSTADLRQWKISSMWPLMRSPWRATVSASRSSP